MPRALMPTTIASKSIEDGRYRFSVEVVVPVLGAVMGYAGALLPLLPPRKSVTYQPEPLSWKPAAVICLENASAPQAGHCVSGASEIFCSTSLAWPQAPHL